MERYTPQAKEALSLAVGVAESLNHGYVGTEHLLIGLLQEGTGVAAKVLEENGVEEDKVMELVSQLIAPNPTLQTADTAAYTPRARRVIETAIGRLCGLRQPRSVRSICSLRSCGRETALPAAF